MLNFSSKGTSIWNYFQAFTPYFVLCGKITKISSRKVNPINRCSWCLWTVCDKLLQTTSTGIRKSGTSIFHQMCGGQRWSGKYKRLCTASYLPWQDHMTMYTIHMCNPGKTYVYQFWDLAATCRWSWVSRGYCTVYSYKWNIAQVLRKTSISQILK